METSAFESTGGISNLNDGDDDDDNADADDECGIVFAVVIVGTLVG